MNRTIFLWILICFVAVTSPAYSAGCEDAEQAAKTAAQKRNEQAKKALDESIPDPEKDRSALAGCLETINSLKSPFSMGIQLPSIDDVVETMCSQVDSYISDKINDTMMRVEDEIQESFGLNNPFNVSISANDVAKFLMSGIK